MGWMTTALSTPNTRSQTIFRRKTTQNTSVARKRRHSSYSCPLWRILRTIGWRFSNLIRATTNQMEGDDSLQEQHGPVGAATQALLGSPCGLPAGSLAAAGGHHARRGWVPDQRPTRDALSRSPRPLSRRNGYRSRAWDTRVGTMELRTSNTREDNCFLSPLKPRRRSTKALLVVIQQTTWQPFSPLGCFAGPRRRETGCPD